MTVEDYTFKKKTQMNANERKYIFYVGVTLLRAHTLRPEGLAMKIMSHVQISLGDLVVADCLLKSFSEFKQKAFDY